MNPLSGGAYDGNLLPTKCHDTRPLHLNLKWGLGQELGFQYMHQMLLYLIMQCQLGSALSFKISIAPSAQQYSVAYITEVIITLFKMKDSFKWYTLHRGRNQHLTSPRLHIRFREKTFGKGI